MASIGRFAHDRGIDLRDLVVLLPTPRLLPLARQAWQSHAASGWMPRFETTRTLAAALAPAPEATPGQVSLDTALDRLGAEQLLQGTALARADALGTAAQGEPLIPRLVETAQRFARALQSVAPSRRASWLADARGRLVPTAGPGARELALARLALDWAALTPGYASDVLFDFRPAAWVVVEAGETEPLALALHEAAVERGAPSLRLDLNAVLREAPSAFDAPALAVCRDVEEEAQRAAQCVLDHLEHGERPVGLIALDRLAMRRVRALLEGAGVALADETGWKLSTTRAAAAVMGLLRAARATATSDELVDALKSCRELAAPGLEVDASQWPLQVQALEQTLRRHDWRRAWRAPPLPPATPGLALWHEVQARLLPLSSLGRVPLDAALRRLGQVLDGFALGTQLAGDAAGRSVLAALRLDPAAAGGTAASVAWREALAAKRVDLEGLIAWVDDMLEGSQFEPPPDEAGRDSDVVITPLGRSLLRPFAAVVVPGADEAHLGAWPTDTSLLAPRVARALGMPGPAQAVEDEWHALAILLQQRQPVSLLRRRTDADAPLAPSPWLERIGLLLRQGRRDFRALDDRRQRPVLQEAPVHRPAPRWPDATLLPSQLSATGYDALRACPYQFHARAGLGLREVAELEDRVEKREVGQWLHALLRRFHEEESHAASIGQPLATDAATRRARLLDAAAETLEQGPWDGVAFTPHRAAFERLVDGYLAWLAAEEAAGWTFDRAEVDFRLRPDGLAGSAFERFELQGRMDRVDRRDAAHGDGLRIIDYKARPATNLKWPASRSLENTQLLFYAALAVASIDSRVPLEAGYLALEGEAPVWICQPDAAEGAQRLLRGLVDELGRIVRGAALPALGEGTACEYCPARGLCRRDHWSDGPAADEAEA